MKFQLQASENKDVNFSAPSSLPFGSWTHEELLLWATLCSCSPDPLSASVSPSGPVIMNAAGSPSVTAHTPAQERSWLAFYSLPLLILIAAKCPSKAGGGGPRDPWSWAQGGAKETPRGLALPQPLSVPRSPFLCQPVAIA